MGDIQWLAYIDFLKHGRKLKINKKEGIIVLYKKGVDHRIRTDSVESGRFYLRYGINVEL